MSCDTPARLTHYSDRCLLNHINKVNYTARRAKSEAAREADFDEHRWDVRAFGCAGHDGRTR